MRHSLNWLLRVGYSRDDRVTLLGDLDEEYRERIRPRHGRLRAQGWYLRELVSAMACGLRHPTEPPAPVIGSGKGAGGWGAPSVRCGSRSQRQPRLSGLMYWQFLTWFPAWSGGIADGSQVS